MANKLNTSENVSHATSWCHMTWYMPPCYFSGRYSPNLIFAPVSNEEDVLLGKSHGSCQVYVPCSHRITAYTLNWFDTLSKPGDLIRPLARQLSWKLHGTRSYQYIMWTKINGKQPAYGDIILRLRLPMESRFHRSLANSDSVLVE